MGLMDDIRGATIRWVNDSDDDVSVEDMGEALEKAGVAMRRQSSNLVAEPSHETPRALFHDPYSILDWGGWRQRPSSLTYESLRQMSMQATPIAAIIQLRVNQISQFCRPQQRSYDKGYRIVLRDRREKKTMTPQEKKMAAEIERMLETTGYLLPGERPTHRDSFRTFIKKGLRDILTYDQFCFEKQRDFRGRPSRFICLDGSSIRPAVTDVEHMTPQEHRERVSHVQLYENTVVAEFSADDIAWCVMNPRSDLRVNGFGLSPIEQIVRLVTAWLFGFQYNCLDGDSLVHTDAGLRPLRDLVGESFKVWDGEDWFPAEAVETGHKELCRTELKNGLVIDTSPHHLFRAVPSDTETGELEWVRQDQLRPGDMVSVDTTVADPPMDLQVFRIGEEYPTDRSTGRAFTPTKEMVEDPQFWEMMGFALGDGHFGKGLLQIFPHYDRDADLFSKFKSVCDRHGISVQDGWVRGGKDGPKYPCLKIHHTCFMAWLQDIGFKLSKDGKRFPETVYTQPAWIRSAMLRGLFSADGHTRTHATGYRTPTVCAVDDGLRRDALRALLSVGVATGLCGSAGINKYQLRVQDVDAFCEKVGYLQSYKNENIRRADQARHKWDLVHPTTSANLVEKVRTHEKWLTLPMKIRRVFYSAALGTGVVSRPRLREALGLLGEPIPEELNTIMVEVASVENTGTKIPMYDVIVHNDRHLFYANGVAVHNTKFFTQGSAIKGLINIKGAIPDKQMRAFRRMWYTMISGVGNAWRTPILNAEDIQWTSMHSSNREMEFSAWMDWLTKLICAVYGVDPVEINFQFGNTGATSTLSEGNQEEKITESKDKGLRPLVDHITDNINQHIVWELCPDLEFAFVGLDAKAEAAERKARIEESAAFKTVDEVRGEVDLPPLSDGRGDMIRDSTWVQFNSGGDEGMEGGEGAPDLFGGDDEEDLPDDDILAMDGSDDDEDEEDDDLLAASYKEWREELRKAKEAVAIVKV